MLTNLVCTVTVMLMTNTTERFPTHMEAAPRPPGASLVTLEFYAQSVPDANPTNKWVRTVIMERTTFELPVPLMPRFSFIDKVLSDTEANYHLEKTEKWINDGPPKLFRTNFAYPYAPTGLDDWQVPTNIHATNGFNVIR